MNCSNCNNEYKKIECADITYDECDICGGIFLEKEELNTLATGLSGDIELCSIDCDKHDDINIVRRCSKCSSVMTKVNLLNMSEIIFDYCRSCGSYFVDKNELDQMNGYLKSISKSKSSEEFRAEISGIIVKVDINYSMVPAVDLSSGFIPVDSVKEQNYLIISAYYKNSLNINLSITEEPVIHRLLSLFSEKFNTDCITGNEKFNCRFLIKASDETKLKYFFNSEVTNLTLDLLNSSPKIYNLNGKISFDDKRIIYTEGPYADLPIYRENKRFNDMFIALSEIALRVK